jgi:hypothetical protein
MDAIGRFHLHEASIAARMAQFEREAAEIRDARKRFAAMRANSAIVQAQSDRVPATPERSHASVGRIARARLALSHLRVAPQPSRS